MRALEMSWAELWKLATTDRALAAYRLTFGASFLAALVNAFFGTILAWVLVRYQFPGRRFVDALVDFPFALPDRGGGPDALELVCRQWLAGPYPRAVGY